MKILKACFVVLSCTIIVKAKAQDKSSFSSIEVQPTAAYIMHKGKEARVARIVFHGGKFYNTANVSVLFNGITDTLLISANAEGLDVVEVPLPGAPVAVTTQATITVAQGNKVSYARCLVEPARKWSVFILPHSHVDIGYTNVQEKVLKLHMENIDESIALAEKTKDYPAGSRYKWNTEAVWVVENYLAKADESKRKRFWNAVKNGWIGVDAAYGNINTSATGARQLLQMFYTGKKLGKENGIDIKTMFQGDVPGSSMGLSAQVAQTGVRYFLSGPNASDRIGYLAQWQDKPFYWQPPSKQQKLLFWQCQPYSIGYRLKGSKIPNFFTIEDPKPYYTGNPQKYFLNPDIFNYLATLEKNAFPYNMTLVTWALSDNAPIDPELPDAVKEWNEKYVSPKLVICTTNDFFETLESNYKDKIPVITGDYTEYWTDGLGSAARETGINRNASEALQQADGVMAIKHYPKYPAARVNEAWKNMLLFSEHTWGAYNSVEEPENEKVKSEWAMKSGFALNGGKIADSLLKVALNPVATGSKINVYNTNSWNRTDVVLVPAALSGGRDIVKTAGGKTIPSQRLKSGELAFVAEDVPALGARQYILAKGRAGAGTENGNNNTLDNGIYTITVDNTTGNITNVTRKDNGRNIVGSAFNKYIYLPGDSLEKMVTTGAVTVKRYESGPVVNSLVIESGAPGANALTREIRLVQGIDRVEVINNIDKKAVLAKESLLFQFPFAVPEGQVKYDIPWGSVKAEADQLPYANRNWYTIQRWLDVSNNDFGVTWSSPDAPLAVIGKISIANLLGGLHFSPQWKKFTEQSPLIYSWAMNNLWHTNFPARQSGPVTFRYYFTVHGKYNDFETVKRGFENTWPLLAGSADQPAPGSLYNITGDNVYTEGVKPSADGRALILYLVNAGGTDSRVTITSAKNTALTLHETNILEESLGALENGFILPAKGILMVRVEEQP